MRSALCTRKPGSGGNPGGTIPVGEAPISGAASCPACPAAAAALDTADERANSRNRSALSTPPLGAACRKDCAVISIETPVGYPGILMGLAQRRAARERTEPLQVS